MESLFSNLESASSYLEEKVEKNKITNERQSVVKDFVEALNLTAGTKYQKNGKWVTVKKVLPSYVAYRLSHLDLQDLYFLLSSCKDAKCGFSKCFYGSLKVK